MNANKNAPRAANLRKKAIAAATTIAVALIAIMVLMLSCTSAAPGSDVGAADTPHTTQSNDEASSSAIAQGDITPDSDIEIADNTPSSDTATEQAASSQDMQQETEKSDSASQTSTSGRTSPSSDPTPTQSQKIWVEDTERVWVIDKEAWTESVPVYSTMEVSICNICGTDITGSTSSHAKEHMRAGEGSGHHSETRQKIAGYESVSHKEEGHWETKVVGGHWE